MDRLGKKAAFCFTLFSFGIFPQVCFTTVSIAVEKREKQKPRVCPKRAWGFLRSGDKFVGFATI